MHVKKQVSIKISPHRICS